MSIIFFILFLITYILFFILDLVLLKINFKNETNTNFDFKNHFSFESHNFKRSSLNLIYRTIHIICSLIGIVLFCYIVAKLDLKHEFDIYFILSGCLFIGTTILKIALFFTKTLNIKLFLAMYVLRFIFLFLSIISFIIALFFNQNIPCSVINIKNNIGNTCIAINFILLFITISCLLFKNFYNWSKLEVDENNNLVRPNVILLCLYEWIFNIVEVLFIILITILFIICV